MIDTREKRQSIASAGCPALPVSTLATGSIGDSERASSGWTYSGFAPDVGAGGGMMLLMRVGV